MRTATAKARNHRETEARFKIQHPPGRKRFKNASYVCAYTNDKGIVQAIEAIQSSEPHIKRFHLHEQTFKQVK